MSSNGDRLVAVDAVDRSGRGGNIYTSSNSGAAWTNRSTGTTANNPISGNKNWHSIAMSDDGRYLAAVVYNGHLYTSDNYGVNWKDRSE